MGFPTKVLQGFFELPAKPNPHHPIQSLCGIRATDPDLRRGLLAIHPQA
jgi:hypothetical protein